MDTKIRNMCWNDHVHVNGIVGGSVRSKPKDLNDKTMKRRSLNRRLTRSALYDVFLLLVVSMMRIHCSLSSRSIKWLLKMPSERR